MPCQLTLGAEEELHVVDLETWRLCARGPQILAQLPSGNFVAELQRTTVETNTEVVSTLDGLRQELLDKRRQVKEAAAAVGAGIAAVGTAPRSAHRNDFELTARGRFAAMQEQYRLLVDEQLICGLQVHVGVCDRDIAVAIAQRVERDLPALLALSASSPYWDGADTGYASFRWLVWQRWPSAGAMGAVASADAYDAMLDDLVASGVLSDPKMAYFDVRPSSFDPPTVELRVTDGCPIVDDAVLIAGLFRAMVRAAEQDIENGVMHEPRPGPLHRAAMWQAARGGLSGRLLDSGPHGRPGEAAKVVLATVARLRPQLEELGDYDEVLRLASATLRRGNSADRQRAAFAERGDLDDVMRLVVDETQSPRADGPRPETAALVDYAARAGDEAVLLTGEARPTYRPILEWAVSDRTTDEMRALLDAKKQWALDRGLVFGVGADAYPYDVDLVPRVVHGHVWRSLAAGLEQRARALELFLQDAYGEQRVVQDGVVPAELLTGNPGWREEATRLPSGTVHAPIQGFDLVRNELGDWRVLEDNLRNPSGIAYACAARDMLDALAPDMPRPAAGLLDPRAALGQLRALVRARCGPDGLAVLLTPGPDKASTFFEHEALAKGAGMVWATVDDLDSSTTSGHRIIVHRASGRTVDAMYLRLADDKLTAVRSGNNQPIGAHILAAASAGTLYLLNAPGNGVADDKAVYAVVPELIRHYLGERPLLESVPTYRTADESERALVLARTAELVTKPVDGFGGAGVLVGPRAARREVAKQRRAIAANPHAWVAQEMVALSSHPTFAVVDEDGAGGGGGDGSSGGRVGLEPRHVDLRAFVFVTGAGRNLTAKICDAALTRVAPRGSMVVNSSKGGGAKDTWVVRPEQDEPTCDKATQGTPESEAQTQGSEKKRKLDSHELEHRKQTRAKNGTRNGTNGVDWVEKNGHGIST